MAIYRGSGSAATTTDQATIDAVAEDAAAAATSATNAATSATAAASSASSASTSATNAASSASSASSSSTSASSSASNAANSATAAASSATSAATSATSASNANTNAQTAKTAAETAQTLAEDARDLAESYEADAQDFASDAQKSAYGAEDVLQTLSDSSTLYSARHYAAKAEDSYNNTTATVDAAVVSATAAAAASATAAAGSATTAASEATDAASSATDAANSATAAQAAEDAALAALDSFDDRYLGQKASDPTLDNDGNALVAGALYFNTTDNAMKVYDGSNWLAAYASLSGALIAANNLSDLVSVSAARTNLGLGTAATTASTDYATAAQGALADSAVQPSDNISGLTNDSGYITGNQTITLSGDVSGSGTTSIAVTVADDSHNHVISNVDGLQTALDGKQATGDYVVATGDSMTGDLSFGDSDKAIFGAGSDLQIYHDEANTVNVIKSNTNFVVRTDDNDTLFYAVKNGESTMYYDNAAKISATSVGATVYGNITVTGTVDGVDIAALNSSLGALATLDTVNASTITDNSVGAAELNVSGNGTTSQFLRSDGDGTFTWATPTDTNTTYSAGSGLDLSGTTFSVESDLRDSITHVGYNSNHYAQWATGGDWFRVVLNGSEEMRLENDGDLHVDGDVIAYSTTISDERLKENIVGIDDALDKVSQLNGYTFNYKADGKVSAGVIAQEVEKVLPEAVSEKELPLKADDDAEYKVVNYDALHGLLIEAIKELKAEIEALKGAK